MNTSTVARKLGVSPSTIGRWVRQLNLEINRNEYGHFIFSESDVNVLKEHQARLQQQTEEQLPIKQKRIGTTANPYNNENEMLKRLDTLERKIDGKADRVVSYQLLQHRQEIESIHKELAQIQKTLTEITAQLSVKNKQEEYGAVQKVETKKKTPIRSLFRF